MGLLTSLLPGLRDLRAPLASGLLWLGVLVAIFAPHSDRILRDTPEGAAIKELLASGSGTATVPLLVSVAFLIGSAANTLSQLTARLIGSVGLDLLAKLEKLSLSRFRFKKGAAWLPIRLFANLVTARKSLQPISLTARQLIVDAVQNIFGRSKAPGSVSLIYPIDSVLDSLSYSAAHLAVAAPTLYQEYDRLRSESEFRVAVVPPMLTLAILLPLEHSPYIILFTAVGCCVLLAQAVQQVRAANNILANAVYLDHATLPNIQSVADAFKDLVPQPETDGQWIGALIAILDHKGLFDEANAATGELADHSERILEDAAWYLREHDRPQFRYLFTLLKEKDDPHQAELVARLLDAERFSDLVAEDRE
ncbi:hypothetical protein MRQ36_14190 [Micromonospora sp. R77]|uniref:hypothetical protein n=1 Tax=Micromonospora sp. R77 TaxID=2925836 RepID=UPI001F609845|nr:hypothetical protein [Micromonospora sp. R77]MCI4063673.1 hypothetical protein [Micromonospora sp. R77]